LKNNNGTSTKPFNKNILYPVAFVILLWVIKFIEEIFSISFIMYGLYPGEISGLRGLIFAPLVHANYSHLACKFSAAAAPGCRTILFLHFSLSKGIFNNIFYTNIFVWFVGRSALHIGASGIVYGLVTFIFFSGVIRRDARSIALSLIVTFLYGKSCLGGIAVDKQVSWESHLFGALTGIYVQLFSEKVTLIKNITGRMKMMTKTIMKKPEISYTKGYPWEN